MRISTYFVHQQRIAEMQSGQSRLQDAQEALSTGKRIRTASDAPTDAAELLRLRSETAGIQRRQSAINAALPQMQAGEAALGSMSATLSQLRQLALQANSGASGPEADNVLADQIRRLRDQLVETGNTQSGGQSVFAGTATDAKPFGGSPVAYSGNGSPVQLEVGPGTEFDVSVTGDQVLNARGGTDLFQNLEALETAVRQGDSTGITNGLAGLDADMTNVSRIRADMGSRIQYVQTVLDRSSDSLLRVNERAANLEGVDMAEAVVNEQAAEQAQQATLAMAGRLDSGPSLLNYLG